MKQPRWLPLATLSLLALATLACATVTNLLRRPTATPPPAGRTAMPPAAERFVIEGGPTIGTPREARLALAEGAPELADLAAEEYTLEELNTVGDTLEYTLTLTETQPVLWGYGWCATSRAILRDNLDKMVIEFFVNGIAVPREQFNIADYEDGDWQCRSFIAVIDDWPAAGTTVEIETRITYTEAINDGRFDFPAGEKRLVYRVTVR